MSPLLPNVSLPTQSSQSQSDSCQLANDLEILTRRIQENPSWTVPSLESLSATVRELLALSEDLSVLPRKLKVPPNVSTARETQASMMPRVKTKKKATLDSNAYGGGKNSGSKAKSRYIVLPFNL